MLYRLMQIKLQSVAKILTYYGELPRDLIELNPLIDVETTIST